MLATGPEPHFRWRQYAATLLKLAERFGVSTVLTLGALYDGVPHTRPTRVSAIVNRDDLWHRAVDLGFTLSEYSGPSSFHTTLMRSCSNRGLPSASFWGHAPIYARVEWNPVVTHALLERIGRFLGMTLPLEPFVRPVARFNEALDQLTRANAELAA